MPRVGWKSLTGKILVLFSAAATWLC